ncbi:MAG: winged helix-turn-helix domain-containing protein [Gammaproteobacteria bacterium]|nr:winged helix-turn-helix domain-containing protein [Gammaproteobacteria bacterium]
MIIQIYEDIPHHKIAKVADVCENTVRSCFDAYSKNGIEGLKVLNFYQPESSLKPFDSVVREYFKETPPATISEACFEIEKRTKVSIKNTQMRKYIKAMDIKYRKVNTVPAKADLEAQEKFHDEELQPRLQEACAKKRQVYFVDAAHFVQGAFLGFLWSFTRLFVRTPSGRKRFNVLGALREGCSVDFEDFFKEYRVSIMPGSAFSPSCEKHFRVFLGAEQKNLLQAMDLLETYFINERLKK